MIRSVGMLVVIVNVFTASSIAFAQKQTNGIVIEHSGDRGELIVSRDGVVYWLSTGDDLYPNDVLRAQNADMSTIMYNGCVVTLPQNEDVRLDEEFCLSVDLGGLSMAQIASEHDVLTDASANSAPITNAPLIVGGVVLSAGGLVSTIDGGSGGTGSTASVAAGAAQASVDP